MELPYILQVKIKISCFSIIGWHFFHMIFDFIDFRFQKMHLTFQKIDKNRLDTFESFEESQKKNRIQFKNSRELMD